MNIPGSHPVVAVKPLREDEEPQHLPLQHLLFPDVMSLNLSLLLYNVGFRNPIVLKPVAKRFAFMIDIIAAKRGQEALVPYITKYF